MPFVHMICRNDCIIGRPPHIRKIGIAFHIDPDVTQTLTDLLKHLFVAFVAHNSPVKVVKGIIFVCVIKRQAKIYHFLPGSHVIPPV